VSLRLRPWLPAIILVATALCLRGPFAAVGPVLDRLKDEYVVSTTVLALVASLPLICFALVSPMAPRLASAIGVHRAALAGSALLAAGVALRVVGATGLVVGTLLLGVGIAIVNVLLPAVVRAEYGGRSSAVLGLTTGAIALSASIGAGAGAPLADLLHSVRWSLAVWVIPLGVAVLSLGALSARRPQEHLPTPVHPRLTPVLRDPVGFAVTAFFGLQSLAFYVMLTWLPQVLRDDAGVSAATSGLLLASAAFLGAPASLLVPRLATRTAGQAGWAAIVALPTAIALVGLVVAPAAAPALWALLYGLGTGAAFPLAMTLIMARTRGVMDTGRLSAAAQCFGYLLAATGPLALGLLHDITGAWRPGHILLLGLLCTQTWAGAAAARARTLSV
jgi:CP family cyanate transporter-like MFS transporter